MCFDHIACTLPGARADAGSEKKEESRRWRCGCCGAHRPAWAIAWGLSRGRGWGDGDGHGDDHGYATGELVRHPSAALGVVIGVRVEVGVRVRVRVGLALA